MADAAAAKRRELGLSIADLEKLEKLAAVRDKGLLTQEEFEHQSAIVRGVLDDPINLLDRAPSKLLNRTPRKLHNNDPIRGLVRHENVRFDESSQTFSAERTSSAAAAKNRRTAVFVTLFLIFGVGLIIAVVATDSYGGGGYVQEVDVSGGATPAQNAAYSAPLPETNTPSAQSVVDTSVLPPEIDTGPVITRSEAAARAQAFAQSLPVAAEPVGPSLEVDASVALKPRRKVERTTTAPKDDIPF